MECRGINSGGETGVNQFETAGKVFINYGINLLQ